MEATLEPRLVMRGAGDKPYVEGEFFVASYQRGYRWGKDEVRQLLDDIRANAEDAEERGEPPSDYFLQPIVVLSRDDNTWELVDGQQRLTTLFLITKYIQEMLPTAQVEYSLTYETREGSRDYLETLDPSRREENIDFYYMAAAYDAIHEWFDDPRHGNPLQAAIDLHTALTKWVYVIWYEAPKETNPNELFTRLNRDRIPLTDSELIKALVLSHSGADGGHAGRREEVAAQWDSIERDLRKEEFWAFLTGSTAKRSTHIDFLFESMTPDAGILARPRYWTFGKVREAIESRGAEAFWRDVVERHGLLTGWFHDRWLYHRVGYLVAIGDSVSDLITASRSQTHSAFRSTLRERTRDRLNLTRDSVAELLYGKKDSKCRDVLLLMNVETVLGSNDPGSRFSFHQYASGGWSLEHIHAQNATELTKEAQRRDWLEAHVRKIRSTPWPADVEPDAEALATRMDDHLAMPAARTDDLGFESIADEAFALFGAPGGEAGDEERLHGLGNLALLQHEANSKLSNAVFAIKRERIIELDQAGAYILPCTRNVFLKYYTAAEDQQLSIWSPQDQDAYYEAMLEAISDFLIAEDGATTEDVT